MPRPWVHPNGHTHWVKSVVFSPDGRTLVTGSADQTMRLWKALRCFQWVTQREVMYAGAGWVRVESWSLAAVR
ncbi:MAG: hypothetical protein ACRDQY_01190 [Pseudonocardiaceae bacterium]